MSIFTNINQSSNTNNTSIGTNSYFIQEWTPANTTPVVDGLQGSFDDVPTMGAVVDKATLRSIDIFARNSSGAENTWFINVYDQAVPATSAEINALTPYASSDVRVLPNQPSFVQNTFTFSGDQIKNFTQGQTYFFLVDSNGDIDMRLQIPRVYPFDMHFGTNDGSTLHSYTDRNIVFRINMSETIATEADPKIYTLVDDYYHLPINNNYYCLYDSKDPCDRLIINAKCHIRKTGRSYLRFVYVYHNGIELLVRLPNLAVCKVTDNVDNLVDDDNVPRREKQKFNSQTINEIDRNSKCRKYLLQTNMFGSFHMCFKANKFGFSLHGNTTTLNTDKSIGCYKGSEHMMEIPNITFKSSM